MRGRRQPRIMTRRRFMAAVGAAGALASPSAGRAVSAARTPVPNPQAGSALEPTGPGRHPLMLGDDRDGLIYVPRGYNAGTSMPLVVMLHGAGSSADGVSDLFPLADEFGVIVLAPESRDWTWDVLLTGYGPDVEFIGAALKSTLDRCTIDRQRLTLAGISDGASYALSLGIGNGDTFGRLMAFSPGIMRPAEARGKPRIFISHGRNDAVMPIEVTSRTFVARLKALGYDVTYREFEGGHTLPAPIAREAFEWLGRS